VANTAFCIASNVAALKNAEQALQVRYIWSHMNINVAGNLWTIRTDAEKFVFLFMYNSLLSRGKFIIARHTVIELLLQG